VLDLVSQSKCSAYDCEFVALANLLGTVLVTEDKPLLKAFPKVCRSLAEALEGDITRR
jgi:predicted nucleic acid-binding protein